MSSVALIENKTSSQLISLFTPNLPWEKSSGTERSLSVKSPTQMSPDELEIALFNTFLKARFANGYGLKPRSDNTIKFKIVAYLRS